jgi:hypothetical protein
MVLETAGIGDGPDACDLITGLEFTPMGTAGKLSRLTARGLTRRFEIAICTAGRGNEGIDVTKEKKYLSVFVHYSQKNRQPEINET